MNSNKIIKFGIIGCGRIFAKHYEIFSKNIISNIELVAICDLKKKRLGKINDKKIIKFQNFEKLLKLKILILL